jgi:cytochrome b561
MPIAVLLIYTYMILYMHMSKIYRTIRERPEVAHDRLGVLIVALITIRHLVGPLE